MGELSSGTTSRCCSTGDDLSSLSRAASEDMVESGKATAIAIGGIEETETSVSQGWWGRVEEKKKIK